MEGVEHRFLDSAPSAESIDYVTSATQFQLHSLLTEQRHPKTMQLSQNSAVSTESALEQLFSVDEDICKKLEQVAKEPANLQQAADAIQAAIKDGRKIFFYGCGATGRLCKVLECGLWRPFWTKVKRNNNIWKQIKDGLKKPEEIEEQLIGEITGGDRALVSSLEGFEDLQIIGRRQMEGHGVHKGDVVFAVTEGGETSSVIGVVLAARMQYADDDPKCHELLYFVYNNPDEVLLPFERSRSVLENDAITKIKLFTGPQAITGSTRMQATTVSLFALGIALEHALHAVLASSLQEDQLKELGFHENKTISERLLSFGALLKSVQANKHSLAALTELESSVYASGHFSTYFAVGPPLMAVFTDVTERSPTFSLFPLDTTQMKERRSWINVCTAADNLEEAWIALLGRPFYGLNPSLFSNDFDKITNSYLREAATRSLANAGQDQEVLYDFSLNSVTSEKGDLVVVIISDSFQPTSQSIQRIFSKAARNRAHVALIDLQTSTENVKMNEISSYISSEFATLPVEKRLHLKLAINTSTADPLGVREQVALKMLLNAHSTALMTRLGRVVGNTMTNVKPSNLKLIGRATYLIQLHVNAIFEQFKFAPISYADTNAVLFEAIEWKKRNPSQSHSEVELAIVRILQTAIGENKNRKPITWEEAFDILENTTLEKYLSTISDQRKI